MFTQGQRSRRNCGLCVGFCLKMSNSSQCNDFWSPDWGRLRWWQTLPGGSRPSLRKESTWGEEQCHPLANAAPSIITIPTQVIIPYIIIIHNNDNWWGATFWQHMLPSFQGGLSVGRWGEASQSPVEASSWWLSSSSSSNVLLRFPNQFDFGGFKSGGDPVY